MFGLKFESLTEGYSVEDPKTDYKNAERVGKYRLSDQAIYAPDGKYLVYAAIDEIRQDKGSAHVTGCCIGCVAVDRLVVYAGGKPHAYLFDSLKQAEKAKEKMGK